MPSDYSPRNPTASRNSVALPWVRKLRALLEEETYDVILCDFVTPAGIIPWDCDTPKVVFTHNVEATIWKPALPGCDESSVEGDLRGTNGERWRRRNDKYLRLADHVLTVSENDRDAFAAFVDSRETHGNFYRGGRKLFPACPTRGGPKLARVHRVRWIGFRTKTQFSISPKKYCL